MVDRNGPGGTTTRWSFDRLAERGGDGHPGRRGPRDRARRPGRHLGAELRRVDRGRPGRGGRRRRAGPPQHPVQGGRGGLHPAGVGGPDPLHRAGVPRAPTTRPCSTRRWPPARRCPTSNGWWSCARTDGRRPSTATGDPVGRVGGVPGRGRRGCEPDVAAGRTAAITPADLSDLVFTSGTTGHPKGAMTTHGADPADVRHLGRGRRPAAGRPLPDRQPVLPHLRLQGGHPGLPDGRGHHGARAGVRRRRGAAAGGRRADQRAARARPPSSSRSSTTPKRDAFDLSTLRLVVTGAAVVPVELVEALWSELGIETVLTAYGLTEAPGRSRCADGATPPR